MRIKLQSQCEGREAGCVSHTSEHIVFIFCIIIIIIIIIIIVVVVVITV
jgi:hypothetical protein